MSASVSLSENYNKNNQSWFSGNNDKEIPDICENLKNEQSDICTGSRSLYYSNVQHMFCKGTLSLVLFQIKKNKDSYWPFVSNYVICCWELIT